MGGSNVNCTLSYATAGPDTRTTQLFINLGDNSRLDAHGFSQFATVSSGMDIVMRITDPTPGKSGGVDQESYTRKGNDWIVKQYPDINFITSATIMKNETKWM